VVAWNTTTDTAHILRGYFSKMKLWWKKELRCWHCRKIVVCSRLFRPYFMGCRP